MGDDSRWLSDTEQQAWRNFLRLQSRLLATLARRLQTGTALSLADYSVLVALTDVSEGRLRVLDLARALDWEQSRMSHHVGRMSRRGLVERADCPDDGRGAFVVITPAGRAAIEDAAPQHVRDVRELFLDHLSAEELASLDSISRRILARLPPDGPQDRHDASAQGS